jgi:ferrochelatase
VRNLVVRGIILPTRPKKSAEAYEKVWTSEGSPLLVMSARQQKLLAEKVSVPVALAMRYGEPSIASVVDDLAKQGVDRLLVMPLYPHYAMSSYETVVVRVMEEIGQKAPKMKVTLLQPFYRDPAYIEALVESARPWLAKEYDMLLFSFHGIPERHLQKSDPSHAHCLKVADCCETCHPAHSTCYRHQCYETVRAFVAKAGIPKEKYRISFQSRLGRDPWLKPYTDFVLRDLPKEGYRRLLVICPAFVADCLETLEEIAMSGKADFLSAGGTFYEQIPCLNDHPAWIRWLETQVQAWLNGTDAGLRIPASE